MPDVFEEVVAVTASVAFSLLCTGWMVETHSWG